MPRGVKGRKKAQGIGAGEAANLLNAIYQQGLDEGELLRILRVDQEPCDHTKSPCRANRKDRVACFCQLVPAETSFRKKGLWQKEQAHLDTLGQDPAEDKRENAAKPAGLRNLGNTCYANAALQCLFSIPSLRNGILNAEPKVSAHDIFRQLQGLFLQMQFGPRSSVDTEALAKTLGLNHAIQQDGQEFLKLLLTRIEQMLSKSSDPDARSLVQRLFRGGLSYVTTCQRCGRDSTSSREVQDFYDLMPQVRGLPSLIESLAAILHADLLTGDNRYRCDFCAEKVDALRHVRLRSLPPYLCLALQRFYFDPRTADKAKALDKFSFPLQLDFRQVLEAAAAGNAIPQAAETTAGSSAGCAASVAAAAALEIPQYAAGSPLYELVAILIHKGSQANSGHYVAHIRDQTSGQWWRFDDESADWIGSNPTAAFQSDHGSAVGTAAAPGTNTPGKGPGSSRKRSATGDPGDDPDYDDEQGTREQPATDDGELAPKSAKGGRGKKQVAQGRSKGRPVKRPTGPGRGRGRAGTAAVADDSNGDVELARAMEASLDMHKAGTAAAAQGEDDLRRALAASLTGQHSGSMDAEMTEALEESASLNAAGPNGARNARQHEVAAGAENDLSAEERSASLTGTPGTVQTPGRGAVVSSQEALGTNTDDATKWAGGTSAGAPDSAIHVVSANAYMLVYRAVGFDELPAMADASLLAEDLQATASAAIASFMEQCDVYQRQRHVLKEQLEARQQAVRQIMSIIAPTLDDSKRHSAHQQFKDGQDLPVDLTEMAASEPLGLGSNDHAHLDTALPVKGLPDASASPEDKEDADIRTSMDTLGYWVSTAWLEQWANDEGVPPPIDNSAIVCTAHGANATVAGTVGADHNVAEGGEALRGRLDPRKVTASKLVSPEAWKRLLAAHSGGPILATGDVCRECLANNFNAALLGNQADVVRSRVAAILEKSNVGQAEQDFDDPDVEHMDEDDASASARQYWVSKLWLQGWSKRQGASVKAEKSPTADIACPHGQLLPAPITKTARRIAVPGDVWCFLRDLWRQQRYREAQEAQEAPNNRISATATKAGRGSRGASRSSARAAAAAEGAAAVDCLDLTGDDSGTRATRQCRTPPTGGGGNTAGEDLGNVDDGDEDDGVVEVVERTVADAISPVPSSREATADADEASAASGAAAPALSPHPAIPTPQELEALCPDLQVSRVHECRECRVVAGQAAEAQADTRRQVDTERLALGGLAAEVMPTVEHGTRYYLVPSAWVREWQSFVKPVSRRAGVLAAHSGAAGPSASAITVGGATAAPAVRPGPVRDAMLRSLCLCHLSEARLGVPLPRLSRKRNKICQQDPDQDALRIIHEDDWRQLCILYGAPKSAECRSWAASTIDGAHRRLPKTRTAATSRRGDGHINLTNSGDGVDGDILIDTDAPKGSATAEAGAAAANGGKAADAADGSLRLAAALQGFAAELMPAQAGAAVNDIIDISVPAISLQRDRYTRDMPSIPDLKVWPPVCTEALAEHNRAVKEAMLTYQHVEVMVELVPQDELEGVFRTTINAPERKSKRSRKGRIALTVSNTTTLEQLKLQVYETLSIHPRNQAMYVRGEGGSPRLLEGDDLSLAQHEVMPSEEIRLIRRNMVDDDDDDVVDLLGSDDGRGKQRQVEEGFKNTALHGDLPQQLQTAGEADRPSEAPQTCKSGHQLDFL